MKFRVNNDNTLTPVGLAESWIQNQSGTVELRKVSDEMRRGLEANAKYWQWCHTIEQAMGWNPGDAHRYHKWHFGLAILTREKPEYRDRLLAMLRSMSYEDRLAAMDLVTCTSLFTVSQFQEFMDAVQRYWAQENIILE